MRACVRSPTLVLEISQPLVKIRHNTDGKHYEHGHQQLRVENTLEADIRLVGPFRVITFVMLA